MPRCDIIDRAQALFHDFSAEGSLSALAIDGSTGVLVNKNRHCFFCNLQF
jgi:hypothetical protein